MTRGRIDALDGVRAVAVVLVLLFHSTLDHGLMPGGFVGVDVFFVLSGYLITTQLLSPRASLRTFLERRLARLWPAVLVTVGFVVLVTSVGGGGPPVGALYAVLYLLNVCFAYKVETGAANMVSHMWSLGIEVQFYVAWALVMLRTRLRASPPTLLAVALGIAAASWMVRLMYLVVLDNPSRAYFATEARLDAIFIGVAIAAARPDVLQRFAAPAAGLVAVLAAAALGSFITPIASSVVIPAAAAGTALVISAVLTRPTAPVVRALAWWPMVWLGERSYSLYLWHFPVFVLLLNHTPMRGAGLVIVEWVVALAVAAGSYRFVEAPSRRWLYQRIGGSRPDPVSTPYI